MFDWSKQVILLTGGTGSFGQAFTRYLLKNHPPKSLRIFSRDEYKQYVMQQKFKSSSLRFFLGDVRDANRLKRAMDGVTLVVHAAALKQIVASEYNPTEAIQTNIIGTMNVIDTALDAAVERIFGLITDKAVSPINLYGATKLCVEKLLVQSNSYVGKGKTKISCVRYGNVAGSRGSVIPLFISQRSDGVLTLTHKDMTRFWITVEQGVKFVIHAIQTMQGGEVFIPKLPSFRVADLARAIASEARLQYTGIRPGEKLHEDLITIHESRNIHEFKDYFILIPTLDFWSDRKKKILPTKVPENYSYSSQNNTVWLTSEELQEEISTLNID